MSLNEILTLIAQVFFVTLTLTALVDYLRHRDTRRRDFALLCSALGIPLGITLAKTLFGFKSGLTDLLGALALFSQPYFLFRLLQYHRPSRRGVGWLVLGGMVLTWVILILYIARYPATTQVIIFGYCALVGAYCTWEYSHGLNTSAGIMRRRLTLTTISAGLMTLALAGNVFKAVVPSLAVPTSSVGLFMAAVAAVLYYLAFIPPRWLRHAWQFEELRDFIHRANLATDSHTPAKNFQFLATAATQAVNGMVGAVVRRDEMADEMADETADEMPEEMAGGLKLLYTTDSSIAADMVRGGETLINQVLQTRQSTYLYLPDLPAGEERRQLESIGARAWLLVPIQTREQLWGFLVVLLRDRALFIDDSVVFLELLCQHSAMLQENYTLIAELQKHSQALEVKVAARTSELQQSEAALRELNATLEQRIEQRTAELERSNRELDQFAYVASHDLKAPLRAIRHLADWIEQDAKAFLPPASQEHLAKLKARVQRMETLLSDLLAYSRVGRQHHPVEMVNVADLVEDVAEIIAPPPGFKVEIHGPLPTLHTERTPLETIFRNLLGNAIKHHDRATQGCVEIRAKKQDSFVEFIVRDDGPGIPPEYHQRIFEIFQTLQPRDKVEGSGVGLAIVKKSVESRGGAVQVESALGKGTTFRFTWPQNGHI